MYFADNLVIYQRINNKAIIYIDNHLFKVIIEIMWISPLLFCLFDYYFVVLQQKSNNGTP